MCNSPENKKRVIVLIAVMMILRLWTMYNRSRLILGILLTSYVAEVVPSTIGCIVYTIPQNSSGRYKLVSMTLKLIGHHAATVIHILDLSACSVGAFSTSWKKVSSTTQLIHAAVMCILVIIQFIRESVQIYKATKQRELGQFMNLFVMEGVLYFFAYVLVSSFLSSVSHLFHLMPTINTANGDLP